MNFYDIETFVGISKEKLDNRYRIHFVVLEKADNNLFLIRATGIKATKTLYVTELAMVIVNLKKELRKAYPNTKILEEL
jgi:hypothetical protein